MTETFSIGFPYAADRFGGSTASSLVLAHALRQSGHRVHILVHGPNDRLLDEVAALELEVVQLPPLTSVKGYDRPDRFRIEQLLAFPESRAIVRNLGLDIIHTNDLSMLRCWAMPSLATSAALVAHWRSNFCESWSVKAALRVARTVVAVSHYSYAKLPPWVQAKTVVEYNSIQVSCSPEDGAKARAEIRAKLGLPSEAALIGVFGNHIQRKRTHVLADLLATITHTVDGRPVYGIACGARAEPYDHLLDEKIAQFGLESRLFRPGFMRPVEQWMAACDVIVAPAINEPLARNILEAQALSVPVVISADGGLKELIRDGVNGLVCDPDNIRQWERATRKLLNHRRYALALAAQGRAAVADLSPARHAQRISGIYRGLFNRTAHNEAA